MAVDYAVRVHRQELENKYFFTAKKIEQPMPVKSKSVTKTKLKMKFASETMRMTCAHRMQAAKMKIGNCGFFFWLRLLRLR